MHQFTHIFCRGRIYVVFIFIFCLDLYLIVVPKYITFMYNNMCDTQEHFLYPKYWITLCILYGYNQIMTHKCDFITIEW